MTQLRWPVVVSTVTALVIAIVLVAVPFHGERAPTVSSTNVAHGPSAAAATEAVLPATEPRESARSQRERSVGRSAAALTDSANWDARYRTEDLFSFAQSAALEALKGDGRAAWLLSLTLVECKVLLVSADQRDPGLRGSLAELPAGDVQRCERFRTGHPLDGLELPEEARLPGYWRDLAIAAGDGRAVVSRAVRVAAQVSDDMDATARASYRQSILDDLRVATMSKDPEAIATLSAVFLQPSISHDHLQSAAWILAACELGYDCSETNPSRGHVCVQRGTCNGTTLVDEIRSSVSASDFAKAYAASQDIAYNVRNGNWDALQRHLAMDL